MRLIPVTQTYTNKICWVNPDHVHYVMRAKDPRHTEIKFQPMGGMNTSLIVREPVIEVVELLTGEDE